MIVGGINPTEKTFDTELWNFDTGNKTIIQPTLPQGQYKNGLAMFIVDEDFCKK